MASYCPDCYQLFDGLHFCRAKVTEATVRRIVREEIARATERNYAISSYPSADTQPPPRT